MRTRPRIGMDARRTLAFPARHSNREVEKEVIVRSTRLILIADATILLSNVVSSLIGARALGPAGRGDLLIVVLWPPVVAMLAGCGLPTAYRYWMAKEPERASRLFSNAVIYTAVVGVISIGLADLIVPHLVGQRSPEVMTLLRIYQVNIPAALFLDLMRGLLEGTRRFGWAGAARLIFFGVQAGGFAVLWYLGRFTVATATLTMISAQTAAMLLALIAVWKQLRPRWQPSWAEFKTSMSYGVRDYPGGVADFTTLRLDQLMLGAMASNVAIGLYVIAVRLSEVTTLAANAIAAALMPEVAASRARGKAESLWASSLRLTIYMHVLLLVPLWLGAPFILKTLFGASFVPATAAFRWLLLAAAVWGWGSIVISGLRGFGYPGLSTMARFSAAIVTGIALVILLPRLGITGAAIASLIGYSVMLIVALFIFIRKRRLSLWDCLRPQRRDILFASWKSARTFAFGRAADGAGGVGEIQDELAGV
ncbi:MAG TPA: polysaccharide biosynthesis C-terminal domain-containing protein [Pyrinomonadaceae bacterium]|nr:polysaccharide biosynthesis C-terminal domain-containing protein [Pyrinomonadaceae bacterium]